MDGRVLSKVVARCRARVQKHAACLARMSQTMSWTILGNSEPPGFDPEIAHCESSQDTALLGKYSEETHLVFANKQRERLLEMENVVRTISNASLSPHDMTCLERLTGLAYMVRKSSSARQIIRQSISCLPRRKLGTTRLSARRVGNHARVQKSTIHSLPHVRSFVSGRRRNQ